MSKLPKDEWCCVMCEYYDGTNDKSWCKNPKGTFFMLVISGANISKNGRKQLILINQRNSNGDGYVTNIWDEWQKKAYRKGLYHE